MKLQDAREDVVQAGKQLVEAGLIARTWGNVGARISGEQFVITPSGRAYETLTPGEIVTVNIEDGSYRGPIKPSSEKGIHAAVYRQREEINFIVHTHQTFASVVSALHRDLELADPADAAVTGSGLVPCAAYGLPGSKKLRNGVVDALSRSEGKAFLMANHGALCLGETRDEAFRVAARLEQICADYIMRRYQQLSGRDEADWDGLRAYYLAELSPGAPVRDGSAARSFYSSEREEDHFRLYRKAQGRDPVEVGLEGPSVGREFPPEAEIHRLVYRRFKGIGAIIHAASPDIVTLSRTGRTVSPLLDDLAQIVGVNVRAAGGSPLPAAAAEIVRGLRGRHAVMITGHGALCCGRTAGDAAAAAQILDKGCRTVIGAALFGGARPINLLEAYLMRFVYLTKYARMADG